MFARPLQLIALGALIVGGVATEASACCGWCAAPCGALAPVVAVGPLPPVYVVNQGPVYSGPSLITYPGYFEALAWPRFYPSVTTHYPLYSGYFPYGYSGRYHAPISPYYR